MVVYAVVMIGATLTWIYRSMRPPPPNVCGSPNGPPITSPRIKLSDGRHLSYKETGVARDVAKYKVIVAHGFDSSKDIYLPLSKELLDELSLCVITFDRAGYGESDPNPKRTVKSEAIDIQELADQLKLGAKFHVLAVSLGTYSAWSCLKYIPHRLAGAALVVPVTNYWWPSFPSELTAAVYNKMPVNDKIHLRIVHHFPALLYWYMTQKWFSSCTAMEKSPVMFNKRDLETIKTFSKVPMPDESKVRQQGVQESLHRDLMIGFGKWEFDPMELSTPFPNNEGSVHLWQGYEDKLVPTELQRYVVKKLPWIKYHEVADGGHLLIHEDILCESIFRTLVVGGEKLLDP